MRKAAPGVLGLLIANGIMYVFTYHVPGLSYTVPGPQPNQVVELHRLVDWFALWFPANLLFQPWQFLTHIFMHGGGYHLAANMITLFSFGMVLEKLWGPRRFLVFFLACGLGAGLIQTGVNGIEYQSLRGELVQAGLTNAQINGTMKTGYPPDVPMARATEKALIDLYNIYQTPMVGASGAVYGVMIAFVLMFPNAKLFLMLVPVPVPAKFLIPAIIAIDVYGAVTGSFTIFGAHIAHFAHLGGGLIGFLLMWYWRRQARAAAAAAQNTFTVG